MQVDLRQTDNSITAQGGTGGVAWTSITSALQAAFGIVAKAEPFGGLEVTGGTTTLLADAFDSALDTTNIWSVSGTAPPSTVSGSCVASLTAANSVSAVMVSQQSFRPLFQHYVLGAQITLGAKQVNPNAHRFFGAGVVTSYAAATPLTNGHGLEVDVTGELNLVVYINGTRYVINSTNPALITPTASWATDMTLSTFNQTMTWPASGTAILFMRYVGPVVYFYMANTVSGLDVPIGVANYVPAQLVLPLRFASITTPVVSTVLATTFTLSGLLFGTAGGANFTLSDPVYPWRQERIDSLGRSLVSVGGLTSLQNSSGNAPNATATATLAAAAGVTTHISGFEITGGGATAGSLVLVTVTGLLGGTATYTLEVATGATVGNKPLMVEFEPPLPASAANTAIVVSVPALGAGNTNSCVVAHGYQL